MNKNSSYLEEILDAIQKIALGDFKVKIRVNESNDELNSIAIGINMLNEELYSMNQELQKKINDLKVMNDLMVGRELKMIELKKEVESLKRQINKN